MLAQTNARLNTFGSHLPALLKRGWDVNPMLMILWAQVMVTLTIGVIGLLVDPRLIVNAPAWAKTVKFSLSIALYAPTMIWTLSLVQRRRRLAGWIGTGAGAILFVEMLLITLQAVRGRAMHFNVSTPFDAALWQFMGASISVFWAIFLAGVILLWRQVNADRVMAWAVRLGLVITFIGMGQGFLMPPPTGEQLAALQAGAKLDAIGAHTVGAPDGGPGLPLLGWSTTHGDLRIGHFVGLHALQALPLLGLLVARRRERWLKERDRVRLVMIGGAGYLGLVVLVTWQALRGQPLLAPDALTLGALGALVFTVLAAMVTVVLDARQAR